MLLGARIGAYMSDTVSNFTAGYGLAIGTKDFYYCGVSYKFNDPIPVIGGHRIRVGYGEPISVANVYVANEYDENGNKLDYWGNQIGSLTREFTTRTATKYLLAAFANAPGNPDAYIYDVTDGKYILKDGVLV